MNNTPDNWIVVQLPEEPTPRIFASWAGGYLGSDSWRLNSSIERVHDDGEAYVIVGASGSVYNCDKQGYGIVASYNRGVLEHLRETYDVSVMTEEEAMQYLSTFKSESI